MGSIMSPSASRSASDALQYRRLCQMYRVAAEAVARIELAAQHFKSHYFGVYGELALIDGMAARVTGK